MEFLKSDIFLIALLCINAVLLILYISNTIKLSKLRKGYKTFMSKLGNGTDITEDLSKYMEKVESVEEKTKK